MNQLTKKNKLRTTTKQFQVMISRPRACVIRLFLSSREQVNRYCIFVNPKGEKLQKRINIVLATEDSLRTADAFPVGERERGREATTGNASAVRRLD